MHMKGYEATAWGELKQLKTVFCSAGKQEVGEEEEEEDAGEGKLFLSIFLYIWETDYLMAFIVLVGSAVSTMASDS